MRNIQLHMIQLSRSRDVLTYSNVENLLNRRDAAYKRACISTSREKYYTKVYKTLVDSNDRNDASFSNEKIQQSIRKVIVEEDVDARNITLDAHNITEDNFCQKLVTPNTQGENENMIFVSEIPHNSDGLAETLKGLTIKNSGYYESDENPD